MSNLFSLPLTRHNIKFLKALARILRCFVFSYPLPFVFVNYCPFLLEYLKVIVTVQAVANKALFLDTCFRSWHQIYSATSATDNSPFRSISLHAMALDNGQAEAVGAKKGGGNSLGMYI